MLRPIKTTYYGPKEGRGKNAYHPEVQVTRGSRIEECLANVARKMTRNNQVGAVVAEVVDETYGELLLVATYFPGEQFQVVMEQDVHRPVCITNYEE
jgi:hypothetical protein